MSLRRRIVLPFVLLFTAAYGLTVLLAVRLVGDAAEERLIARARNLDDLVRLVPGSIHHAEYARFLEPVYQAPLAVLEEGRPTGFLSLPADDAAALAAAPFQPPEDTFVPWRSYLAVRHGRAVLFYPASRLGEEKRALERPLLGIAAAGLVVVALAGLAIGHSVARPLERLAATAGGLGVDPGRTLAPVGGGPEMEQLVEALNRMLETLRRTERLAAMGRMAAGIAHEIKNPLAAMKMTVQLLREEKPGPGREPYDLLLREIERLDLAASELSAGSGPGPLAKEPADLARLSAEVLDLLAPQLAHLGVTVERRLQAGDPVPVDANRVKRALMNLVLNGAQAMPRGGPLVVSCSRAGATARLEVSDRGPGIPAELRGRIFDPFVTTKADGVGLGLALTKRLVEEHGGRIGFESSPAGSTFWIELPAA